MELETRRFEVVPLTEVAPLLGTAGAKETKAPRPEKILSVSAHESLALTRFLLLSAAGFQVSSALSVKEAIQFCKTGSFNLVVIGHSLPVKEKQVLLKEVRRHSAAPVLGLYHRGEGQLADADYVLDSTDGPAALLEMVNRIIGGDQKDR